eukprot:scaffold223_cov408-Prasinococcus_capsulatus_cf.AAC.6
MKQFRSSNVLRERHGYRIAPDREAASADDFYELFAKSDCSGPCGISPWLTLQSGAYSGDLEGGHYITYLQCPEPSKSAMAKKTANSSSASSSARRWAKCDDACISWVEEREVLTCQSLGRLACKCTSRANANVTYAVSFMTNYAKRLDPNIRYGSLRHDPALRADSAVHTLAGAP